jgi:hypothetical protein
VSGKGIPAGRAEGPPQADLPTLGFVSPVPLRGTALDQVEGPSEQIVLWTVYGILVSAGIVALLLPYQGQIVGDAEGSVLLAEVVSLLKTIRKR